MWKKILVIIGICLISFGCQTEPINQQEDLSEKKSAKVKPTSQTQISYTECAAVNVDRSPNIGTQPVANFWWFKDTGFFDPTTYFASTNTDDMLFREYADGTANILGTTMNGTCVVTVDVWLKDKMTWDEWSALGGEHKKEGTAGNASNSQDMNFYVIDSERSIISAAGSDCAEEGVFGVEQRPDPNDNSTPNYGAHIGVAGANFDSDINALGLSTWGWLTDSTTGERLWLIDFNFTIECETPSLGGCETAFAKGNSNNDHACFDQGGFNRWGWNIGPLTEGTYTYDVYAAAGQCDISKGTRVGTVTIEYNSGNVTATYNLLDGYVNTEEHLYAGTTPYPVKNNGRSTVAPGQYYVESNLSGEIYVIAHSVVCDDEGGQTGG